MRNRYGDIPHSTRPKTRLLGFPLVERLFWNFYLDGFPDIFFTRPPSPKTNGRDDIPGRQYIAVHGRRWFRRIWSWCCRKCRCPCCAHETRSNSNGAQPKHADSKMGGGDGGDRKRTDARGDRCCRPSFDSGSCREVATLEER